MEHQDKTEQQYIISTVPKVGAFLFLIVSLIMFVMFTTVVGDAKKEKEILKYNGAATNTAYIGIGMAILAVAMK